jgi:hypothetical protein
MLSTVATQKTGLGEKSNLKIKWISFYARV